MNCDESSKTHHHTPILGKELSHSTKKCLRCPTNVMSSPFVEHTLCEKCWNDDHTCEKCGKYRYIGLTGSWCDCGNQECKNYSTKSVSVSLVDTEKLLQQRDVWMVIPYPHVNNIQPIDSYSKEYLLWEETCAYTADKEDNEKEGDE